MLLHGIATLIGKHRAQRGSLHLPQCLQHSLQGVPGEMDGSAQPAAALEHMAHGLGQSDVSIGGHQPHATDAALIEAVEEFAPERLAFTVADLQGAQLSADFTVNAHGLDVIPLADL